MLQSKEQAEPLRYERKFLISDYSNKEVEQMIQFHPACFSEIFHERIVNNIYFDTLGLGHYYDNIEGAPDRLKVRIRWYGEIYGNIQDARLEFKIKKGLLGKKEIHVLNPFVMNKNFNKDQIENSLKSNSIPKYVKDELMSLRPSLLNSYTRKYYLSADKNFRITIDHHLSYYRIGYGNTTFANRSMDHNSTVLELKYDSELENEAKSVGNMFPFSMTKNSKYLQGLERVFI